MPVPGSGSSFPDATNPDGKNWYVTNAGGLWRDGEAVCQSEKETGWHFWHPMSALQNSHAWNAMVTGGKFALGSIIFKGRSRRCRKACHLRSGKARSRIEDDRRIAGSEILGFGGPALYNPEHQSSERQ